MKSMLDKIARDGWSMASDFLTESEVLRLRDIWQNHAHKAKPGALAKARRLDPKTRGDSILWLEEGGFSANDPFLVRMHQLQSLANRELFLNLHNFEAHFASYPVGAGYEAHFDQAQVRGQREGTRVLSAVIYLNSNWQPQDGGELVLWNGPDKNQILQLIPPRAGTLVLFRSDLIFHEVRAAQAPRLSIAGWFRREQPLVVS